MTQINQRRAHWAMSSVLIVLTSLLTANMSAQAAEAYPGRWSITMVSEADGAVDLLASGGTYGEYFYFKFLAADGQRVAPGWYPDAQRAGFQVAGRPGVDHARS